MPDHPWTGLERPASSAAISARRIDDAISWDLYWAVDHEGRELLVLGHGPDAQTAQRLPRLREIDVRTEVAPSGRPMLVLRLLDRSLRDVFERLSRDIVDATARCDSESAAVSAAVARTWRWHHLLRGGGSGLLRPEEQKGLVGELLVLEQYVLPALGPEDAIRTWRGPLRTSKDFLIGRTAIESKARGAEDADTVVISSEFQLADDGFEHLFLHLSVIDPAAADDDDSYTLTDIAARVREAMIAGGDTAVGRYDALLSAAGFQFEDDYSDYAWHGGERTIYRIHGEFPRLTPDLIPAAVSRLRYVLSLGEIGSYVVSPAYLRDVLGASVP